MTTDTISPPLAYRRSDLAAMLGVSTRHVDREIAAGRLRAIKSGKATLIPVESARAYIDSLPAAQHDAAA